MADVTVKTRPVTRNKLAQFLKSQELIKAFEDLIADVSSVLPIAIDSNAADIEQAQQTADAARAIANAAAGALVRIVGIAEQAAFGPTQPVVDERRIASRVLAQLPPPPTLGDLGLTASAVGSNPTASVGLAPVNGTAASFMRSDAAPSLDQGISPTWTGNHTFAPTSGDTLFSNGNIGMGVSASIAFANARGIQMMSNGLSIYGTNNNLGALGVNLTISSLGVAKYQASGFSSRYYQQNGVHTFQSAASGTAGNTISYSTSLTLDANGNIYGASGATGMTNGFIYIPSAAGAPTGTPTSVSGHVPLYYDSTNNNFYAYNGAWKKVTLA